MNLKYCSSYGPKFQFNLKPLRLSMNVLLDVCAYEQTCLAASAGLLAAAAAAMLLPLVVLLSLLLLFIKWGML